VSRRSHWEEWDYEYPKPRRPADGIKARTQRGKFGATWWAGRWLAALERLVDSGRLSRGRSYARSGQVTRLGVGPRGVDARVQGSRPTPYRVTIRFRELSATEWAAVVDAMAAEAIYAARLLSGEMPEEIETAFQAAGVSLFPAEEGDLTTDCTCPDWANPCKHVAAVFYLLGERFDADPFVMFELRGRTRAQIIEAMRARRVGGAPPPGASLGAEPDGAMRAPVEAEDAAAIEEAEEAAAPLLAVGTEAPEATGLAALSPADAFWSAPTDAVDLPVTFRAPAVDALPLKLLGAPPFWQDWPGFAAAAEAAYRAIGERAVRLANGESS
jgi:uncharacterized Zn finger protein